MEFDGNESIKWRDLTNAAARCASGQVDAAGASGTGGTSGRVPTSAPRRESASGQGLPSVEGQAATASGQAGSSGGSGTTATFVDAGRQEVDTSEASSFNKVG